LVLEALGESEVKVLALKKRGGFPKRQGVIPASWGSVVGEHKK